jgi:hypothetical protein
VSVDVRESKKPSPCDDSEGLDQHCRSIVGSGEQFSSGFTRVMYGKGFSRAGVEVALSDVVLFSAQCGEQ